MESNTKACALIGNLMQSLWFEINFFILFSIQELKICWGQPKTLVFFFSIFIIFLIEVMHAHNPVSVFPGLKISFSKMHT